MNKKEVKEREEWLEGVIKAELPVFWKAFSKSKGDEAFVYHQDAFGADYQISEMLLLGMFVKFLGMSGREIRIFGKNRETLKKKKKNEPRIR